VKYPRLEVLVWSVWLVYFQVLSAWNTRSAQPNHTAGSYRIRAAAFSFRRSCEEIFDFFFDFRIHLINGYQNEAKMLRFVFCDFLCKPYATAVEYFSTSWTRYSDERMQKLEVYMEDDALENSVTSNLENLVL